MGNPLTTTGSMADTLGKLNPFRYRGYIYDTETGLYYLGSRYYNPTWGRFVNADSESLITASPDSAIWGKNLLSYCDSNPTSRKDSGGYYISYSGGEIVYAGETTRTSYSYLGDTLTQVNISASILTYSENCSPTTSPLYRSHRAKLCTYHAGSATNLVAEPA